MGWCAKGKMAEWRDNSMEEDRGMLPRCLMGRFQPPRLVSGSMVSLQVFGFDKRGWNRNVIGKEESVSEGKKRNERGRNDRQELKKKKKGWR